MTAAKAHSPPIGTDELRSALRAFRAGLAGAYAEDAGVLEANFRAAVARHGTGEAARMARTGHPEVGTLRPARTVAERARLLQLAEGGAAAGERVFEMLGAPRGVPVRAAPPQPATRTRMLGGIPAERIGRPRIFHYAEQIPAFLDRLRVEVERLGRGPVERLRAGISVLTGITIPGGRRAEPERVREAFEAYQDEMARRTGPLPRAAHGLPGIAARLLELADRFRNGLRGAYEDPQRAEHLYHRMVSSDLAPEVAERVERNPALLGSLRDDPGARRTAVEAAGLGAQAYRIHLGDPLADTERDALVAAALAHERAQTLGREVGRLHDDRLRAAQVLAALDARDQAAVSALAAMDAAFASAFGDGTGAARLFRQTVALRGAPAALEQLRGNPPAFGVPAGRLTDERRRTLLEAARAALEAGQRAAAPVQWSDPAGVKHAGAPAVRAAAARVRDHSAERIADIRAELGPDGVTRHRQRIIDALAASPPARRAELAAALAEAAPTLAPTLHEIVRNAGA